jgi:hypothetical protein
MRHVSTFGKCAYGILTTSLLALPASCGGSAGEGAPRDSEPTATAAQALTYDGMAGIQYGNGPVMTSGNTLYYIFYGAWSDANQRATLEDLGRNLAGSPLFNVMTTYGDSHGTHVNNNLFYGGMVWDNYSQGEQINRSQISAIVHHAIYDRGVLPEDPNGIYVVLTDQDVGESTFGWSQTFCEDDCGFHYQGDSTIEHVGHLKIAFVGNPHQCQRSFYSPKGQTRCVPSANPTAGPNGDWAIDEMATVIVHEVEEIITDPDTSSGWADSHGNEVGDLCQRNFQEAFDPGNGTNANVQIGGRSYWIQSQYSNVDTGGCVMRLSFTKPAASTTATTNDFNGDGNSDILWRSALDNSVWISEMNGTAQTIVNWGTVPSSWQIYGIADFNGDRTSDVLWRDIDTGDISVWFVSNGQVVGNSDAQLSGAYVIEAVGDLDGDGIAELIASFTLVGSKYYYAIKLNNNGTIASVAFLGGPTGPQWKLLGTGNLTGGNHDADLVWQYRGSSSDPWNNVVSVWIMNGTTMVSTPAFNVGTPTGTVAVMGIGDFEHAGRADLLINKDGTLRIFSLDDLTNNTGGTFLNTLPWTGYELLGVADYNHDGTDDLLWRARTNQQLSFWGIQSRTQMSANVILSSNYQGYDIIRH